MINKLFCKKDSKIVDVLSIFDYSSSNRLPTNLALVVDDKNKLIGTITGGDVRRSLLINKDLNNLASEIMESNPIVFDENLSTEQVLEKLPYELSKRKRRSRKYLSKIIYVNKKNIPTRIIDYHQLWELKVASHRHLVIIGLGYVGLTMAVVMADAGFLVTGIEIDEDKIKMLNQGTSYVHETGINQLIKKHINKNLKVSNEIPEDGDVYVISVGTPIDPNSSDKNPVMKYLSDTSKKIGEQLKRGNLVILRSTVPIGTTRNFVKEKLEKFSGLNCGKDFHLAFAPERTAEGRAIKELRTLPQIIGGFDKDSVDATAAIFRDITPNIVKVDSLEAAEMVKLINNSFRDYVFAFSNQMSIIASKFNIDVVDIINAANKNYPRNPVPLPSPGVGGPCLTKDPHIFASVLKDFELNNSIFKNSRDINISMHYHVVNNVLNEIERIGKKVNSAKIVICGLAFKGYPETGDLRNSTSIEIADIFKTHNKNIYAYDPVASDKEIKKYDIIPLKFDKAIKNADVILFLNNHKSFEKINIFNLIQKMNKKPIIYDGWNIFRKEDFLSGKDCTYMGLSFINSSIKN